MAISEIASSRLAGLAMTNDKIMNKKYLLFLIILATGIFMRFYQFPNVPPGVNRDEASIGYTAYSLLKTGNDEYGKHLPIAFQSFGDWKLPFYIYEVTGSVKIFGLNEFAVRLPSLLAGVGTVIVTYFLVEEIFGISLISFLSMLLIALSPWSVHLSRLESESNTAVFITTIALLLFFKAIKKSPKVLVIVGALLALCYGIYAGNYVSTTLLVAGLGWFFRKELLKNKFILVAGGAFFLICIFFLYENYSANHTKISGIGIFGDPAVVHAKIELPRLEYKNPNSLQARFFNNRLIYAGEKVFQNYLNSYSPQFLFISGGMNAAHNIQNFGNMYIIEAPFLFLGLVYLIALKKGKERNVLLWWFFTSAIAASITKDAPHTNRMAAILPVLQIVTAFGIWWAYQLLKNSIIKKYLFVSIVSVLFIVNIGIYLDRYYVHFPYEEAKSWGIGYKKLSVALDNPVFAHKHVIMTNPQESPYIFLAFYQKWDPATYQKDAIRYPITSDGFVDVKSAGRFEFRPIDWGKDAPNTNQVLVAKTEEVPQDIKNHYQTIDILLPSGQPQFTIVTTQ